jgi:type I restriction-modification system DNA methylase subunit
MRNIVSKFTAWLTILAPKAATADDILLRFGSKSAVGRGFTTWCYYLYEETKRIPIVVESFEVWKALYKEATNLDKNSREQVKKFAKSLNINNPNVELFLFCIQTYLALLMKLTVAEVAVQKGIANTSTLRFLIGKDAIEGYRGLKQKVQFLSSIFEEDVFDWFLEPSKDDIKHYKNCVDLLVDIIDALDGLDFKELKSDLIRELYHGFFDRSTRRALGEFYTNEDVVYEILNLVGYSANHYDLNNGTNQLLLDPSCGSGSFLVGAIARWREHIQNSRGNPVKMANVLKYLTSNIVGIDIHPFAVAMARVNYILAILDLLTTEVIQIVGDIRVPVYWSDSLITRKKVEVSPVVDIKIPKLGSFQLPDPEDIPHDFLVLTLRRAISNTWSLERFLSEFAEDKRLDFQNVLEKLYKWFIQRKLSGRDGRWLTVLLNSSIIHSFIGKCSYVVGNPPWVRIHSIDEEIRQRLKENFEYYKTGWDPKLVQTPSRFKTQHDYCLAFIESALSYLPKHGKLGFVITSKIMQALYAGIARSDLVKTNTIHVIKDYSSSGLELFKDAVNYPLLLVVEKAIPATNNLTYVEVVTPKNKVIKWSVPQMELSLIRHDSRSPWLIAPPSVRDSIRIMQKFPKIGDLYEVMRGIVTGNDDIYVVKEIRRPASGNLVTVTTNRTDPETEKKVSTNIEPELIYPFVTGENIRPWAYNINKYIIWTHDSNGSVLQKLPRHAQKYFDSVKEDLVKRDDYKALIRRKTKSPIWILFRVNEEKLKNKVAWRELAPFLQAVLIPSETTIVLGGSTFTRKIILKNKIYFLVESDDRKAVCLAAFLNSMPARVFLQSFSAKARGGWFFHYSWQVGLIPIPLNMIMDVLNFLDINMPPVQGDLDKLVGSLYGLTTEQLEEMQNFHSTITSKMHPLQPLNKDEEE